MNTYKLASAVTIGAAGGKTATITSESNAPASVPIRRFRERETDSLQLGRSTDTQVRMSQYPCGRRQATAAAPPPRTRQ